MPLNESTPITITLGKAGGIVVLALLGVWGITEWQLSGMRDDVRSLAERSDTISDRMADKDSDLRQMIFETAEAVARIEGQLGEMQKTLQSIDRRVAYVPGDGTKSQQTGKAYIVDDLDKLKAFGLQSGGNKGPYIFYPGNEPAARILEAIEKPYNDQLKLKQDPN